VQVAAGILRESVVLCCASSCQLATGASWQVFELADYLDPTSKLIMPGSSPSLSTNDLLALSITRRKVGVGVSRDPTILFAASINRPISAAL
jgi:hypothetical protein